MAIIFRMRRIGKYVRGLTLVEVMILLVFIAFLLVMAIPVIRKIR